MANDKSLPSPPKTLRGAKRKPALKSMGPRTDRFAGERTMQRAVLVDPRIDYETDFHGWAVEQTRLLRSVAVNLPELDLTNIAEEIESLARSERRELRSRFTVLILHLLKRALQFENVSKSWDGSIVESREQIAVLYEESPSLVAYENELFAKAYDDAIRKAARETGLPEKDFETPHRLSINIVRDDDFWPFAVIPPGEEHAGSFLFTEVPDPNEEAVLIMIASES